MFADSSTDTKTDRNVSHVRCHMSCVTFHVSYVMCHVLRVACHLSLTPAATASESPPAYSQIMHRRQVCKDPQTQTIFKTLKVIETSKTQKFLEVCHY